MVRSDPTPQSPAVEPDSAGKDVREALRRSIPRLVGPLVITLKTPGLSIADRHRTIERLEQIVALMLVFDFPPEELEETKAALMAGLSTI